MVSLIGIMISTASETAADILVDTAYILNKIPYILATPLEKKFTSQSPVEFAQNNWVLVIGLCVIYGVLVAYGPSMMADREPYDLRIPLACWNAFLCVFSFIGMCRTAPYLGASILLNSFEDTICIDPLQTWGNGPVGFWVMLFIFSKIPELVDTIFIILRKKPLIFLHWYHHITVLLFCWSAYSTLAGSGLYFVSMNYSVHALMYGYYCLHALNKLPKAFPTVVITMGQIAQMFVGTFVCISAWYHMLAGHKCSNDVSNLVAGAIMYTSYLYLFLEFAVKRYWFPKKKANVNGKKIE